MKNFRRVLQYLAAVLCVVVCVGCTNVRSESVSDSAVGEVDTEPMITTEECSEAPLLEETTNTYKLPGCYKFANLLNASNRLENSNNIFHLYDIGVDTTSKVVNVASCITDNQSRLEDAKLIICVVYEKENVGEDEDVFYVKLYKVDITTGELEQQSEAYAMRRLFFANVSLKTEGNYIILNTYSMKGAYYFDNTLSLCAESFDLTETIISGYEDGDYSKPIFSTVRSVGYSEIKDKFGFIMDDELVYFDKFEINGSDEVLNVIHTGLMLEGSCNMDFICNGRYLSVVYDDETSSIYDTESLEKIYEADCQLNILDSYESKIAINTDEIYKYSVIDLESGAVINYYYNEPVVKFDLSKDMVYTESRESDKGIIHFSIYQKQSGISCDRYYRSSYWYGYSQNENDIFNSQYDTTGYIRFYNVRLLISYDTDNGEIGIYALRDDDYLQADDYAYSYVEKFEELNMMEFNDYIDIYYGDEMFEYLPDDLIYEKCENSEYVDKILTMIKHELELYPKDIFNKRYGIKGDKLKLILSNGPLKKRDNIVTVGVYFSNCIVIDISSPRVRNNLHHELWHALEDCGEQMYEVAPLRWSYSWNRYNPGDFEYRTDEWSEGSEYTVLDGSDYFINSYSQKSAEEDRATIFATVMTSNAHIKGVLAQMQPISDKIVCMEEFIRYVYGYVPRQLSFLS